MANADHLKRLRQGIDAWNDWRAKDPLVRPDLRNADLGKVNLRKAILSEANLSGANLYRAVLSHAILSEANLSHANLHEATISETRLREANLSGANLHNAELYKANLYKANLSEATVSEVDLSGAYLSEANLSRANLYRANLRGANLREANLSEAELSGANLDNAELYKANLYKANLREANLYAANLYAANLSEVNLQLANLVDARLDRANLTGAELWETQREGWSIKDVSCRLAFWDREGKEPIEYAKGEFERIFAKKPRIVLRYPGGMSPVDLLALPLIVERLQTEHPGSALQVRSVQNDAGGASVTITVEDLENRGTDAFAAEIEALRGDLLAIQGRLCSEESLRLAIETKYQAVVQDVLPMLIGRAVPKQEFNIGQLTAPMIIEGPTMSRDTYNISGQAGAVGPGAHAHDNAFQQIQAGIDLPKLAEELGRLHAVMKGETTGTREQDEAIVAVAKAEEAARTGNGSAALRHLKAAGQWALGIAEKIGVPVAVEVLKHVVS